MTKKTFIYQNTPISKKYINKIKMDNTQSFPNFSYKINKNAEPSNGS